MAEPRVLVILNQAIGDVIMATGAVRELARREGARLTLVCSPVTAPLFAGWPEVEAVIPVRKKSFSRHWIELAPKLTAHRWQAVVDYRKLGLAGWLGGRLIQPTITPGADKAAEFASILGAGHAPVAPDLGLDLPPRDLKARPILAIGPGASAIHKTWPAERFAELARRLTTDGPLKGAVVRVVGGPSDREAAQLIAAAVGEIEDLCGADLVTTATALAPARLFIGNDSGMMHLSAAAGAPTLGLYGWTDGTAYRPWGEQSRIVMALGVSTADRAGADPDNDALMRRLDVETAEAAARALLNETS